MRRNRVSSEAALRVASIFAVCTLVAVLSLTSEIRAQSLDGIERSRAKDMLKAVKKAIREDYFDPAYRGIDLEVRFKAAEEKLEAATSLGQAFGIIAQAVLELNDSHTKFYPPSRAAKIDYGWQMQMIGDKCFVTAVRPGSDADKKGLKPGDEVVQIEGFRPSRKELWKIRYYYNAISPRTGLNVKVKSPGDSPERELNLASKVTKTKVVLTLEDVIRDFELDDSGGVTHRFVRFGNTVVWKMPSFVTSPESIDEIMQSRIRGSQNLVLDLRNNGGGLVLTLERLAGYFVEKDTEIANLKGRKPMKPMMAKVSSKGPYIGKLVVLVDSNSGSASELFARFMQLQQRGVVIGDRSAGAVMQSRSIPMELGTDSIVPYGMSLTNADVILADGLSLEHVGVTPHFMLFPSAEDLAARRDPVLAAALKLLGQEVSPQDAGKAFPVVWEEN